jgi:hypothetical protein
MKRPVYIYIYVYIKIKKTISLDLSDCRYTSEPTAWLRITGSFRLTLSGNSDKTLSDSG